MDKTKYRGMDVHKETISIAVLDSVGKQGLESIVETKAATILAFMEGLLLELQRKTARGVLEWRNLLFAEGGADRDRTVAGGVQHTQTPLGARL